MRFKITRSKFLDEIKSVQNIVTSKGSLAILSNAKLEAASDYIKLTTTDLDISIETSVKCEVLEPGASTIPVKLLSNAIIKAPEGEVEVAVDETEQATISAGSARFKIKGKPEQEFPRISSDEEASEYRILRQVFHEMLRKTAYAASQDDTRRTLKGVLMSFKDSKLTMVATDGRRLALVEEEIEFPANCERDIVLPSKAVQELLRSVNGEGEAKITVQQSRICIELGQTIIYSKLIDDTYPNYRQVIPQECAQEIIIDRQLLLDALDRASVMTLDELNSTKLIFATNKLVVMSAAEAGEAQDTVPIKYAGETNEIMFNPGYVMDPLKAIDDDEIVFNLNNGHSPAVIKCSIPFIYVLMPLRVS